MGCNRNNDVGGASNNRRNRRNIAGVSNRRCNNNNDVAGVFTNNGRCNNNNDVAGVANDNFRVPVRSFIDGEDFCRAVNRCIEDDVLAEAEDIRRRRRKRRHRKGNIWERLGLWF
ncbi:hypothetical protein [Halobacillus sp. Marseille-P3879]|uniref:hypothetical protein n=1 Tax=Halobacillus sp. Marseille-P3879 TaxID=2045014 RepID=UPI001F3ABBF3|nr:hypothetical protein [Halobacillus sp. Marseille-P3879]